MKKWNGGNNDYDAFPSRKLQVAFGNIVAQSVGTAFVSMPLFELVEAICGFEKSCSGVELQKMLCGLKKTDFARNTD